MLETQFETLRRRLRCAIVPGFNAHLENLTSQLAEYFAGKRQRFESPLVCPGTPSEERLGRPRSNPYRQTRY
jgi:AraC family transcriptional regulator of adaptative response/methylated-DNA-[protein]-cysteine methyltransferase